MSESYTLEAILNLKGGDAYGDAMRRAAGATDKLQASLNKVREGSAQIFGVVEGAARMVGAGMLAGGALVAVGAHAIFGNLSMLESKSIQLSTVMAAATSRPFEAMQGESAKLFDQFRQDAITSAGETKDFIDIAAKLAGPIAGAGKGMDVLHDVTAGVMNAAPGMGVAFEQAGSDVMRMLQGVAGIEQPLFRAMVGIPSLGIQTAEKFNKLSASDRLLKVQEALANPAFKEAADAYGKSWAGLLSTSEDVAKTMGGALGGPLFERARVALGAFNDIMLKGLGPDGVLRASLNSIGRSMAVRFDELRSSVGRIFPDLLGSSNNFVDLFGRGIDGVMSRMVRGTDWIGSHWGQITSGAHDFASAITRAAHAAEMMVKALGGGDLGTGMARLAAGFGAAKLGGALAPGVSGAVSVGQGAWGLGKGLLGSAGNLPADAVFNEKAGRWMQKSGQFVARGDLPTGLLGMLGGGGGAAAGAAGGAEAAGLGGLAAAAAPVVAAMAAIGAGLYIWRDELTTAAGWVGGIWTGAIGELSASFDYFASGPIGQLRVSLGNLWTAIEPAAMGVVKLGGLLLAAPFLPVAATIGVATGAMWLLAQAADPLAAALGMVADGFSAAANGVTAAIAYISAAAALVGIGGNGPINTVAGAEAAAYDSPRASTVGVVAGPVISINKMGNTTGKPAAAAPKGGGGGGKQEIVIKWDLGDGNEDAIFVKTRRDIVNTLRSAQVASTGRGLR